MTFNVQRAGSSRRTLANTTFCWLCFLPESSSNFLLVSLLGKAGAECTNDMSTSELIDSRTYCWLAAIMNKVLLASNPAFLRKQATSLLHACTYITLAKLVRYDLQASRAYSPNEFRILLIPYYNVCASKDSHHIVTYWGACKLTQKVCS